MAYGIATCMNFLDCFLFSSVLSFDVCSGAEFGSDCVSTLCCGHSNGSGLLVHIRRVVFLLDGNACLSALHPTELLGQETARRSRERTR